MLIIERPRNSGKTTMLLHYMVFFEDAIYIAWTEEYAKCAFRKSQELGLEIAEDRFMSAIYWYTHRLRDKIALVDDIDVIIQRDFKLGTRLIRYVDIVTKTKETK